MNWNAYKAELEHIDLAVHRFMPACPDERIRWFEANCCTLPPGWIELLQLFNGAELFIDGITFITLFGIKLEPPLAPLDWPAECCLDDWYFRWLQTGNQGMPIARTCYDSLWIFEDRHFKEWDWHQSLWLSESIDLTTWQEKILSEGRDVIESE